VLVSTQHTQHLLRNYALAHTIESMKKLSTYLFLILFSFSAPSFADDIRDFQIEGMSVGDSLLDYFSKEEIENFLSAKKAINYYPKSKKFFTLGVSGIGEYYEQINFDLKNADDKYIIYSLDGYNRMSFQECTEKTKLVSSEIKKLFEKEKFSAKPYKIKHRRDKSRKSIVHGINFIFDDDSAISISCYNWGEEMEKNNFFDSISINVSSKEFFYWVRNEAY